MKALLVMSAVLLFLPFPLTAQEYPGAVTSPQIKDPGAAGFVMRPVQKQFAIGLRQLLPAAALSSDPRGFALLLDLGDTTLFGRVFAGQAYFDDQLTDYPETRYRTSSEIVKGKSTISLRTYFDEGSRSNANAWTDRGVLGYRFDLLRLSGEKPVHAGIFDSRVHFKRIDSVIVPIVSIVQPPMLGCVQSDHPEWCIVTFTADRQAEGMVDVEGVGRFAGTGARDRHELVVRGLLPDRSYRYRVLVIAQGDTAATPWLSFRSAPSRGKGRVVFAYAGDGRAATGGGEYEYAGVNRQVGAQIARQVRRLGASFLLFGGDLIAGYTNSLDEFRMELMAFREAYGPLLQAVPLYSAIGNHDALLNYYDDGTRRGIAMDRWPYSSESTEAVFAAEFIQPANGPANAPGRPPYSELVYSFHFGPVKVIVLDNNYWFTSHNRIPEYGGSPEGYILPEQTEWLKKELAAAERDPAVRHVVVMAQEPFFPGGGHVSDAMWHGGDNRRRAYGMEGGKAAPLGPGMVDLRNGLWALLSGNRKVALVLGSDEHNYQRFLIDRTTPVGIPVQDDRNGNGVLDDGVFSPDPAFGYPTWFVVSGGAGAPYYTREEAPWSGASKAFTPQANFILFTADERTIGIKVYTASGQLIDTVDDLKAVKR